MEVESSLYRCVKMYIEQERILENFRFAMSVRLKSVRWQESVGFLKEGSVLLIRNEKNL